MKNDKHVYGLFKKAREVFRDIKSVLDSGDEEKIRRHMVNFNGVPKSVYNFEGMDYWREPVLKDRLKGFFHKNKKHVTQYSVFELGEILERNLRNTKSKTKIVNALIKASDTLDEFLYKLKRQKGAPIIDNLPVLDLPDNQKVGEANKINIMVKHCNGFFRKLILLIKLVFSSADDVEAKYYSFMVAEGFLTGDNDERTDLNVKPSIINNELHQKNQLFTFTEQETKLDLDTTIVVDNFRDNSLLKENKIDENNSNSQKDLSTMLDEISQVNQQIVKLDDIESNIESSQNKSESSDNMINDDITNDDITNDDITNNKRTGFNVKSNIYVKDEAVIILNNKIKDPPQTSEEQEIKLDLDTTVVVDNLRNNSLLKENKIDENNSNSQKDLSTMVGGISQEEQQRIKVDDIESNIESSQDKSKSESSDNITNDNMTNDKRTDDNIINDDMVNNNITNDNMTNNKKTGLNVKSNVYAKDEAVIILDNKIKDPSQTSGEQEIKLDLDTAVVVDNPGNNSLFKENKVDKNNSNSQKDLSTMVDEIPQEEQKRIKVDDIESNIESSQDKSKSESSDNITNDNMTNDKRTDDNIINDDMVNNNITNDNMTNNKKTGLNVKSNVYAKDEAVIILDNKIKDPSQTSGEQEIKLDLDTAVVVDNPGNNSLFKENKVDKNNSNSQKDLSTMVDEIPQEEQKRIKVDDIESNIESSQDKSKSESSDNITNDNMTNDKRTDDNIINDDMVNNNMINNNITNDNMTNNKKTGLNVKSNVYAKDEAVIILNNKIKDPSQTSGEQEIKLDLDTAVVVDNPGNNSLFKENKVDKNNSNSQKDLSTMVDEIPQEEQKRIKVDDIESNIESSQDKGKSESSDNITNDNMTNDKRTDDNITNDNMTNNKKTGLNVKSNVYAKDEAVIILNNKIKDPSQTSVEQEIKLNLDTTVVVDNLRNNSLFKENKIDKNNSNSQKDLSTMVDGISQEEQQRIKVDDIESNIESSQDRSKSESSDNITNDNMTNDKRTDDNITKVLLSLVILSLVILSLLSLLLLS